MVGLNLHLIGKFLFVVGVTYNIPVCVWLQENHPYVPPLVFVRPTNTMAIKASQHVDTNGKVYHPFLHEWSYVCWCLLFLLAESKFNVTSGDKTMWTFKCTLMKVIDNPFTMSYFFIHEEAKFWCFCKVWNKVICNFLHIHRNSVHCLCIFGKHMRKIQGGR